MLCLFNGAVFRDDGGCDDALRLGVVLKVKLLLLFLGAATLLRLLLLGLLLGTAASVRGDFVLQACKLLLLGLLALLIRGCSLVGLLAVS